MLAAGCALLAPDVAVTATGGVLHHGDHCALLTRDITIIMIIITIILTLSHLPTLRPHLPSITEILRSSVVRGTHE